MAMRRPSQQTRHPYCSVCRTDKVSKETYLVGAADRNGSGFKNVLSFDGLEVAAVATYGEAGVDGVLLDVPRPHRRCSLRGVQLIGYAARIHLRQ